MGKIPRCDYKEQKYIAIDCGKCIQCRKKKAREWSVRLQEEIKRSEWNGKKVFITLTFSEEALQHLKTQYKLREENEIATKAVRLFLERVRKKTKHSMTHWLITERGHQGTERIHLHGILFTELNKEDIRQLWGYGFIFFGTYVTEKSINYIMKYVTKKDNDHKEFDGKILCSKGIGKAYIENEANKYMHRFQGKDTKDTYTCRNGAVMHLPNYYRRKLFTDKQRAYLWHVKSKENIQYISGIEIDMRRKGKFDYYFRLLEEKQNDNEKMGYGKTRQFDAEEYKTLFMRQNALLYKKLKFNTLRRK